MRETIIFKANGRLVIPADLRRKYGISPGTKATITDTGAGILLCPITREYIHSLRGSLKGKRILKALLTDRDYERKL